MRAIVVALAMFALISLAAARASAQLSPGKLSRAHAELDSSRACLECHATGEGVTQERCLSCHGLLGERIEAGAGLHARQDYQRCETCHIEHIGRDFEMVWWGEAGQEAFDHDETGYPLTGAHRLECRECHQESKITEPERLVAAGKDLDRTFLGLETACVACHQDPHRGQMAPRGCDQCHGAEAWRPASGFDHDRTEFALDGRHAQVECISCHAAETDDDGSWARYGGTATACVDCHRDPHRARLGSDCAACHTTADWRRIDRARFNHNLTRFPLRGRHLRVDCAGCHRGASLRAGLVSSAPVAGENSCAACHDDVHVGQLRDHGACSECHDTRGFKPSRFDFADHAETRFPLDGAHRKVPCVSCHESVATAELVARGVAVAVAGMPPTTQIFSIDVSACTDCHRDPHAGSADAFLGEAGCKTCHDGSDWHDFSTPFGPGSARFDHGATGFELEGVHRTVTCAACHPHAPAPGDATPGDATPAVTGDARPAVTGSVVTGAVLLSFQGALSACRDCHQDPHLGQFDRSGAPAACRGCHSMEGWLPALFDHRDSAFLLEGKHALAECGACHLTEVVEGREMVRYKPLPIACSGCHRAPPEPIPENPSRTKPKALQ